MKVGAGWGWGVWGVWGCGVVGDSLGVCDGHLQHQVLWDLKELWVVSVGLQQEGQHVEAALGGLPAQLGADLERNRATCSSSAKHTQQTYCTEKRELVWSPPAHLSELYVSRVSQDAPVWLLVAGIPDELTVPHPVVVFAVCPLRKDGDGRPAATQTATHTAKHKQTATQPNQSVGAERIRKSTQTRTR